MMPEHTVVGLSAGGRNWLAITAFAILMGVDFVRVGMEDQLHMYPHIDELIERNADAVKKIATIARELGRKIGTPKEATHWDEEKKCFVTDEEKIFEYYLTDGWFKALLSGKREEWIKKEKEKIKLQYEEKKKGGSSKAKFFRHRSGSSDFHTLDPDSIAKEFHGWWKYKDHLYNKDQGLLADAVKKPIVNGKVSNFCLGKMDFFLYKFNY